MDFRRGPLETVLNFYILLRWPGFKFLVLLTLGGGQVRYSERSRGLGCASEAFGCALEAFGCALKGFGCASEGFGCAIEGFGCQKC